MPERRQAHRREPIEVEVSTGDVWVAKPLVWTERNDLGDLIVKANTESLNAMVRLYAEDVDGINLPQLELGLSQKIKDWTPILTLAYKVEAAALVPLEFDDCVELALAALDVNALGELKHLVDPNSPTPMLLGGPSTSGDQPDENGLKNGSGPDSSSSVSDGTPSPISLTPKSE
jgi:hypothetical protein